MLLRVTCLIPTLACSFAPAIDAPDPKPGEERKFEIAPGTHMIFCWVPPGKATLGSPPTETRRGKDEEEREYTSKGFWLGKYEVTQGEWTAVMGTNPSAHTPEWNNGSNRERIKGLDLTRLPAENMSGNQCIAFLKKLNARPGAAKAFGKPGAFVLPHEDEWEYACRGGTTNKQPYYWGTSFNGTQANANGTHPYGTDVKGPSLKRTSIVGSYEKDFPHPWGLCDMNGNVWELCTSNQPTAATPCAIRGGSFFNGGTHCRATMRMRSGYEGTDDNSGFRVCYRLE